MSEPQGTAQMGGRQLLTRGAILVGAAVSVAALAYHAGFRTESQVVSIGTFVLIISATLLFWNFRLAIAFIGIAVILGAGVMTLPQFLAAAELDIILFLIGMMTLVGVLKDLGLFTWIIQLVIGSRTMTGTRFILSLMLLAALLACVVDEITSIIIVLALVFQVCDTLKINPVPYTLIAVFATNIGSVGTMLGNPVGILIGTKAGFGFADFLVWSFPVMLLALAATMLIVLWRFHADIRLLTERLAARRSMQLGLGPLVRIPYRTGLLILVTAIAIIGLHHPIEAFLGVAKNTMLIVAPLAIAGVLMIWRNQRARHYIESEVEWWTLLFFLMLFAVAGSLEVSGVTEKLAHDIQGGFADSPNLLLPAVIVLSALGSALVDNIVFVAALIPVVRELDQTPLWWAMLFGACFGGNITLIGSTANIVAAGMLEKRYRTHISFAYWIRQGLLIGAVTCTIAWLALLFLAPRMPARPPGTAESLSIGVSADEQTH